MTRCFDCFHEFGPTEERFAVLKRMREMSPEADAWERRYWDSLNFYQVYVCRDCAAWYGDHPIKLAAIEADPEHGRAT